MINLTLLKSNVETNPTTRLDSFPEQIQLGDMLWVDAENPTEQELKTLQDRFQLDSYAIEDVNHRNQRPKIEDHGKYVYAVLHVPMHENQDHKKMELYVFFEKAWLVSIHGDDSDLFRNIGSKVRSRGLAPLTNAPTPDLLFYTFLDFAIDEYYPILDEVENGLEMLDTQATSSFRSKIKRMDNIKEMMVAVRISRKRLMFLRKSLAPTRDMIGMVMRGAIPFVTDSSLRSFRDVYDHSFQLMETIDTDRDRASDIRDLYISLLTASTDQIIKMLTIVATIFLPLALLAGIYGTNFTQGFFEPGSSYLIGFYILILAMIVIALGLLYSFRKSGWI